MGECLETELLVGYGLSGECWELVGMTMMLDVIKILDFRIWEGDP